MFDSVKLFTFYLKRNTESKLRIAYKSSCFHYNLSTKVNNFTEKIYDEDVYTKTKLTGHGRKFKSVNHSNTG